MAKTEIRMGLLEQPKPTASEEISSLSKGMRQSLISGHLSGKVSGAAGNTWR